MGIFSRIVTLSYTINTCRYFHVISIDLIVDHYSLRIIRSGTEIISTGASSMYLNQM